MIALSDRPAAPDITLPDILPLEISSTYRSGDTVHQPFGLGTAQAYSRRL